ncbi:hypothetical protein [Rhodococcus wratislaviensis]|uniref:hypothetical protein n=1 Tax=Rhodococcus wratislaviensis TaxID=44752 RepID=UPI000F57B61F|nr:hypothetical protein [Rhodococcus wratislaviensis]
MEVTDSALDASQSEIARVIAPSIRIRLGDGTLQPSTPISFVYDLSGVAAAELDDSANWSTPQILSQHEGETDGSWTDASWDPGTKTVTASLPVLSQIFAIQIDLNQVRASVNQWAGQLFETRFPQPSCAFVPHSSGDTTYQLSHVNSPPIGPVPGTDDVVWPCLEKEPSGQTRLTLHSNTNIVWDVSTDPTTVGSINTEVETVDDAYNWMAGLVGHGLGSENTTQVLSGGSSTFDAAAPPESATVRPNAGLTTFQIIVIAAGFLTDKLTKGLPLDAIKPTAECVRQAMDLAGLSPSRVDDVLSSGQILAQCLETYAVQTGALSEKTGNLLALAHIFVSLIAQLDAQILGVVASLSGPAKLTVQTTTSDGTGGPAPNDRCDAGTPTEIQVPTIGIGQPVDTTWPIPWMAACDEPASISEVGILQDQLDPYGLRVEIGTEYVASDRWNSPRPTGVKITGTPKLPSGGSVTSGPYQERFRIDYAWQIGTPNRIDYQTFYVVMPVQT